MLVGLRDVGDEVGSVFNVVMTVGGQAHQVCAAALALDHIADSFFVEVALGQDTDDQGAVLDEADGAVLQLTRGVGLGVDVADFFHFQAALQGDGIIDTASDKEDVVGCGLLGGEPLEALFILKYPGDFLRQSSHFRDQAPVAVFIDRAAYLRELDGQDVAGQKLGAVGLGGSHRNLRSGQGVEDVVCFSGNGGANHIYDGKGTDTHAFGLTKSRQGVCGLAGLTDKDNQSLFVQQQGPIAEFGRQLHTDRDFRQILDDILGGHGRMICGAAGHHVYLADIADFFLGKSHLRQIDCAILYHRVQGIL